MRKCFLVALLVILALCVSCSTATLESAGKELDDSISNISNSSNRYVQMVKNAYREDNSDLTYDRAFSGFFGTPRWRYFQSEEKQDVVEFTGDCIYRDVNVKARMQFVIDEEEGTFQATYLAFNEVPQDMFTLASLISKAFEIEKETMSTTVTSSTTATSQTDISKGDNSSSALTQAQNPTTVPLSIQLSAEEAQGILQIWLDAHSHSLYDVYIADRWDDETDDRYLFVLYRTHELGFVRVDKVSGELYWFDYITDEEGIPLDDWYNQSYDDHGTSKSVVQGEILYGGKPILNWLGSSLPDLRGEFGNPDIEGVVWEGGTYGYQYNSNGFITFNKSQYGEDIEAIWGSPADLAYNGTTLDKDREGLVRLFGDPIFENWFDDYGEETYSMSFHYQGQYSLLFLSTDPDDKAHEFWISYLDDSDIGGFVNYPVSGIPDNQVESERLRIRDIWLTDRANADNGTYRKHSVEPGITAYSDYGQIKLIEVVRGTNNSEYSGVFLYENGDLIFVFYESGIDAYRLYFHNESMFRMGYTPDIKDSSSTINLDNRGDMEDFVEMQNSALTDARYLYSIVRY